MMAASIAVIIPTRDEERNISSALASVTGWAAQVFVVDSGSTDRTCEIASRAGATVVFHAWEGFARQKNWALDHLPITCEWVFILDADESITSELRDELVRIAGENRCEEDAFYVNRHFIFLGKRISHCGYYPSWNLRFFRRGSARYEERDVHEHMVTSGKVGYLRHEMKHYDRRGLGHYIDKHNVYSTLEAQELLRIERGISDGRMKLRFFGSPVERRRWVKHKIWPHMPARWAARWIYMYILRLGFLDGLTGFQFCLFLAAYEHQISLKLAELRLHDSALREEL